MTVAFSTLAAKRCFRHEGDLHLKTIGVASAAGPELNAVNLDTGALVTIAGGTSVQPIDAYVDEV